MSKDGYVTGSSKVIVKAAAETGLNMILQAKPSSGIPGFPLEAMAIGVLFYVAWLFYNHPRYSRVYIHPTAP